MIENADNSIIGPQDIPGELTKGRQFNPFKLTAQQQLLCEALMEKDQRLVSIYQGALIVLKQDNNPDQLAQAAHGLRELMEKMPEYIDIQIKAQKQSLKSEVHNLMALWQNTLNKTECYIAPGWQGQIDGHLSKLLNKLNKFFDWFIHHNPRRREEITKTLRNIDGSSRILPPPLEELNAKAWDKIRDFFQLVAHHRKITTEVELGQWRDALEKFLLDRLRPRTFTDFDTIDEIISEGESND